MSKQTGNLDQFRGQVDAKKQHDVDEALRKKDRRLATLQAAYDELVAEMEALRAESEFISDIDDAPVDPIKIAPVSKKASDSESVAIAVGSDWHLFETVRPEEVNGMNKYNIKIADQCAETFFQKTVMLTDIHRGGTKIKRLVLCLLGDIITGQLHQDQVETGGGTPQEEVLHAFDVIAGGIQFLKEQGKFDKIDVLWTDGNHGRATEKMRVTNRSRHSNEWLLAQFLKRWFAERDDSVRFAVADGIHLYADVLGRTVRLHHGDALRYNGGIGGITIPMNKAIADWNKGRRADFDIFGHWHTSLITQQFLSNGSMLGYSPFALKIKAGFELPQQSFLVAHPKHWITAFHRLFVR